MHIILVSAGLKFYVFVTQQWQLLSLNATEIGPEFKMALHKQCE